MQCLAEFRQGLRGIGFQAVPVVGDGNCLFRSLCQLEIGSDHAMLRQEVCDYMRDHKDTLQASLGDKDWDLNFTEVGTLDREVGEEVVECVARMRNLQINVLRTKFKADETIGGCELSYYGLKVGAGSADKVFCVFYDVVNKHYSALKVETCSKC